MSKKYYSAKLCISSKSFKKTRKQTLQNTQEYFKIPNILKKETTFDYYCFTHSHKSAYTAKIFELKLNFKPQMD